MPEDDLASVLDAVAPRLRALRRRRGLTLAEVAEATGISVSTLSRLESGGRKPALDLLLPLARHYRVPLDDLVGAPATGDPRIHPRPVRRHGHVIIPLSREGADPQAFKQVLPGRDPRDPTDRPRQRTHEGSDWMYVLHGRVLLLLGDEEVVLEAGEAAEFDTRTPHAFLSAGPEVAEVLGLFSKDGQQVHVRG
ncbi:XRE family transcriptional regulator [Cellulomonas soli]|uniref:XRE family transcriptional regulator n=1 Tax=Cellulomonas soli TaxID=931535 RepID=A0A512PDN1_9CELL|nr:XRE family transcriptional regulator [Cellulomonas soli]NYI60090.1 transcriptional regulator with XRE-family HTH domain [Cellulomonas soli]GEP69256.1 XRE family transcriptional regulator [Cellulomonas soli]